MLGFGLMTEHVEEDLDDLVRIKGSVLLHVDTVLDLLEVEQVVDEAQHQLCLVHDHHDQLFDLLVLVQQVCYLLDSLRHLKYDAKWGAHLV